MSLLSFKTKVNMSSLNAYNTSYGSFDAYSFGYQMMMSAMSNTNNNTYNPFKNYFSNSNNDYSSSYNLSNDKVSNALQIARAELNKGVHETSKNDSIDIRKYKNGAANDSQWCGYFVSYLYGSGQGSSNLSTFGYTGSSQEIKRRAGNYFANKYSGYRPIKGDLAMWTYSADKGHVGIIDEVDNNGFWVIEGNSKNAVSRNYYSYNNLPSKFSGYVQMTRWLNKSDNNFKATA